MKLYRYEVNIKDEIIYGIFQAPYNSIQLPEEDHFEYCDLIERLPCPTMEGSPRFYFTETGKKKFGELIDIMFRAIPKELNPILIKIEIEHKNKKELLYKDRWQVAI